jgi:hypothetical protein
MESKIVKNIYFAGEVIDVDALTGGFNLQIAYSSRIFSGNVRRIRNKIKFKRVKKLKVLKVKFF